MNTTPLAGYRKSHLCSCSKHLFLHRDNYRAGISLLFLLLVGYFDYPRVFLALLHREKRDGTSWPDCKRRGRHGLAIWWRGMKNVLESSNPSPYVNPCQETDVCTLYLSRLDSWRTALRIAHTYTYTPPLLSRFPFIRRSRPPAYKQIRFSPSKSIPCEWHEAKELTLFGDRPIQHWLNSYECILSAWDVTRCVNIDIFLIINTDLLYYTCALYCIFNNRYFLQNMLRKKTSIFYIFFETRQNRRELVEIVSSLYASVEWAFLSGKDKFRSRGVWPHRLVLFFPHYRRESVISGELIYRRTTGRQICEANKDAIENKISPWSIWMASSGEISSENISTFSYKLAYYRHRNANLSSKKQASFGFGGRTCLPDSARLATLSKSRCTLPDFGRKMGTRIRCLPRQSSHGRRRNLPEVSRREDVATWQPRPTLGNTLGILFVSFVYSNSVTSDDL